MALSFVVLILEVGKLAETTGSCRAEPGSKPAAWLRGLRCGRFCRVASSCKDTTQQPWQAPAASRSSGRSAQSGV